MNVLLLSDFSPVAINATHYAMDLLQNQKVNFYLLNIFDPDPHNENRSVKAKTLGILKERVEKLQQRSGERPHKISGHYSEEKLVSAARDFVQQHKIDLIVMGSVGQAQRNYTILGKHTFEIMSKIKCNILAVAEGSKFKKSRKLLLPIDYTASIDERNIKFLNYPEVFKNADLDIWEFAGEGETENESDPGKKAVFTGLKDFNVKFTRFNEPSFYNKSIWLDVQNKFDFIVLFGKNIRICNRLLHNRHGLYTSMPNQLPILVLHD